MHAIAFVLLILLMGINQASGQVPQDTISIKARKNFVVKLKAGISEGYSWNVHSISDTGSVSLQSTVVVKDPKSKEGSDETQKFIFNAKKKGQYTIRLIYSQPWLKEKSAKLKYYTVKIIVY